MSRGLTSAMQTAIADGIVRPVLLGYFDFYGGALRACTEAVSVTWDGHTWTGLGDLVGIEPMRETKEIRAMGMVFSLNGVPSSLIAEVIANRSRGRACTLWLGLYDSTHALIADPVQLFSGRMDQPTIEDTGDTCIVSVSAESRMVDLQRARERRYTDADQQYAYAGDLGMQYVAGLQNKEIPWGQGSSTTNPGASVGGGNSSGYVQEML